jgi:two-component system LytT family sensor kinase
MSSESLPSPQSRVEPIFERPVATASLFWLLQAAGWVGFGAFMFVWGLSHLTFTEAVANKVILVATGIAASLVLRGVFRRARRRNWTARRTALATATAVAVLSIAWTEFHLQLYAIWSASRTGQSPDWTWIGLYPGTLLTNFLVLGGWSLGYLGVHGWISLRQERERARVAEAQAREARLRALRSQLEPHFLFNALNGVSTLVAEGRASDAQRAIAALAEFLRRTMDAGSTPEVPVADEIELVRGYLRIQSVRFGDRLRSTIDLAPNVSDALVPVLILQPIVENAVEHGVLARERGGAIAVSVRSDGSDIELRVTDDGPGIPEGHGRKGVGLANTLERLRELYADAASLSLETTEGGGTTAVIRLPLRRSRTFAGSALETIAQ